MSLRTDSNASAQVVAFVVAGAIFMGALSAVLISTRDATDDSSSADAAAQDLEAEGLADLLIGSSGVDWAAGPDLLGRLGLGAYNGSGLEQSSIDALKGALVESTANSKVDYADAQASLGLEPGGSQDFHIRIYPVGMDSVYDASLSGLRAGYIGDWTSLPAVTVPLLTPNAQIPAVANQLLNLSMAAEVANERDPWTSSVSISATGSSSPAARRRSDSTWSSARTSRSSRSWASPTSPGTCTRTASSTSMRSCRPASPSTTSSSSALASTTAP